MYTFENAKAELQVNKSTFSKSGYEFMENILTELQETYSPVFLQIITSCTDWQKAETDTVMPAS